jgi:hypothetical protein
LNVNPMETAMVISRSMLVLPLLLLAACEKKKDSSGSSSEGGQSALPGRSTTRSASEEDEPDPRIALRASFDRASGEKDAEAREKILESVAWDAIDVDPALSREAFAALTPDSESSRRLVGHFAMRLADEDPERAIEWAAALEQEEERSDAFGRIAVVISATDPSRAATLVSEKMTAGPPRDRAVVQIVQRWSQAAPADAATWIAAFPQGAARSAGIKAVAAAWMQSGAPALAAWIEAREEGPVRTEAVLAAAEALRPSPPETRATRLGSFQDPAVRKQIESILAQPSP